MDFLDFETVGIGETRTLRKHVSEDDVAAFVALTGDTNPLHVDDGFARQTSFQERVVHGMLGASYVSTVIGTQLPGPGALWLSQSFEFLRPVRINDDLTISCIVKGKHDRERILDVDTVITNQLDQEVLRGSGRIQVLRLNAEASTRIDSTSRKCAFITGATGGIGREIALSLAGTGHDVLLHFHSDQVKARAIEKEIHEVDSNCSVGLVRGDLSDEGEVRAIVRSVQKLSKAVDILVNSASPRFGSVAFDESNWDAVEAQIAVHVKAPYLLARSFSTEMKERGWGRIINVTSDAALNAPTEGWMAYGVAKAGMIALTQYMANELGRQGITANCISPGMCRTPFIMDVPEKMQLVTARNTPTRRITEPSDVAAIVKFLCQGDSGQINGQTIHVNGGLRMS